MKHINNMDLIGEMFIPGEDPAGSERRRVADHPVVLYRPKQKAIGLTFFLTAANIPLEKYSAMITALNSVGHIVVGFFVNVFNPPFPRNHRVKAELIPKIFHEIKNEFNVASYNIVGHSVGAKIALLVASLYDEEGLIKCIVGLDPVDQHPVEFTNAKRNDRPKSGEKVGSGRFALPGREVNKNLTLRESKAEITLTFTNTGYFVGKLHSAREIQRNNPSVKLVQHRNSCHMVYCDEGGILSWKALTGRGSNDQKVKDETIKLVKDRATSVGGKSNVAKSSMKSSLGNVKNQMSQGAAEMKQVGKEAKSKGSAYARLGKVLKF